MRNALVPLSLLSTALLACSDAPPPPSDVRSRISDDLRHVLTEGKAAFDGSTAQLPTGAAFGLATQLLGTSGTTARFLALDPSDEGFEIDDIVQTLNEQLFTDANYLGNGIYKVPADLVCKDGETVDLECAQHVAQAQLRIRVEDDEGLHFWIQIDANHDEPVGILLRRDELGLTVNLDDASDAIIALAPLFGEQAPNAALSGQVTGSLKILGPALGSASLTIDRALSIKVAEHGIGLDSDGAMRFTSAAADVVSTATPPSPARRQHVAVPSEAISSDVFLDVDLTAEPEHACTFSLGGQQAVPMISTEILRAMRSFPRSRRGTKATRCGSRTSRSVTRPRRSRSAASKRSRSISIPPMAAS